MLWGLFCCGFFQPEVENREGAFIPAEEKIAQNIHKPKGTVQAERAVIFPGDFWGREDGVGGIHACQLLCV